MNKYICTMLVAAVLMLVAWYSVDRKTEPVPTITFTDEIDTFTDETDPNMGLTDYDLLAPNEDPGLFIDTRLFNKLVIVRKDGKKLTIPVEAIERILWEKFGDNYGKDE